MNTGFETKAPALLLAVRENLLQGLDIVAGHVDRGTADAIPLNKSSSPIQAGFLTLLLLESVEAELCSRGLLQDNERIRQGSDGRNYK